MRVYWFWVFRISDVGRILRIIPVNRMRNLAAQIISWYFAHMAQFTFVKSVEKLTSFPRDTVPEIALVGRSNAGKSSFVNTLSNERLAKVSQKPGKTRLLNLFYNKKDKYRLVDMPGYGWSSRSAEEMKTWTQMVEDFLHFRPNLCGLLLIMDIRRDWAPEEQMLLDLALSRQMHFGVILSKSDKLSKNDVKIKISDIKQVVKDFPVVAVSNLKKTGADDIEKLMWSWV